MGNICEYGCGREATHQFKNGKWCCEDRTSKCPEVRNRIGNSVTGKEPWNKGKKDIYSKETLKKMRESHEGEKNYWYGKSLEEKHKNKISESSKGKILTDEHRKSLSISLIGNDNAKGKRDSSMYDSQRLTIHILKERYPLFSKVEEMRYNPDKPGEKEIQVHCKNHKCPNSKEKGGWFTQTYTQLYERIRQLEKDYGNDGCYLYCSEECKQTCPLYNIRSDPNKKPIKIYTENERKIWAETVLEEDNYTCQICGSKENLHCHHIIPVKINPMLALDPDNGITFCEECHYKYGHKDECNLANLANRCKRIK